MGTEIRRGASPNLAYSPHRLQGTYKAPEDCKTLTRLLICIGLSACILLSACKTAPDEVYREMLASAHIGYEDGFVEGFSTRSRPIVRALLRLADVYGFESRNPLTLLDADDASEAAIYGDFAVVTVHRGNFEREVLFVTDPDDDDNWRVDLSEFERFMELGSDKYRELAQNPDTENTQ